MKYNASTPLSELTVGDLQNLLRDSGIDRRYVYGRKGICALFNCGLNKAQTLKDTVIKDAVSQVGRKIMVDVDKALSLYSEYIEHQDKL